MDKLCITTVADKNYLGYVPMFLYGVSKLGYTGIVFIQDSPGQMQLVDPHHTLIYDEFEDYPRVPRLGAFLRYLAFTEERLHYFDGYDYVYVTDVDMILCPEYPELLQQHEAHCNVLGLSYSNIVRVNEIPTLSGLHFMSQDCLKQIAPIASRYDVRFRREGLGVLDQDGPSLSGIRDERLLYQIVRDSGLGLPKPATRVETKNHPSDCCQHAFRPWHGINLGAMTKPGWESRWQGLMSPIYADYLLTIFQWMRDEQFRSVYDALPMLGKQNLSKFYTKLSRDFAETFGGPSC
jgi:hypothetical protein